LQNHFLGTACLMAHTARGIKPSGL
jgi:hypothetical protein